MTAVTEGFERYPFPQGHGMRTNKGAATRGSAITIAVIFGVIGVTTIVQHLARGEVLFSFLALNVLAVFVLLGFGVVPERDPRRSFRYINAVVMTRAEQPPADSWVHLAPTRPGRVSLMVGFVWGTLGLIAVAVSGVLQLLGIMPLQNTQTGIGGVVIATILTGLIGALCTWLSAQLILRRVRDGSFGTRPSGVALGETSVAVRMPGIDLEIPWDRVLSVEPHVVIGGNARNSITMIKLQLARGSGLTGDAQMLAATGYRVPSDALYTALRWYSTHPEARWELGRIEGQRRLEGWRLDAIAAYASRQVTGAPPTA